MGAHTINLSGKWKVESGNVWKSTGDQVLSLKQSQPKSLVFGEFLNLVITSAASESHWITQNLYLSVAMKRRSCDSVCQ